MATDEPTPADGLTADEVDALHEVELGVEWLKRAHGALLEFHHNTGHAMEHLAAAETGLRESGHDDLADAIRDLYLPRGVIDEERWSYDVVESFEAEFMDDMTDFADRAHHEVADGRRHVAERRQEQAWKGRADRE